MGKVEHKNAATGRVLKRGAIPSSRQRLLRATPFVRTGETPSQVIIVPPYLEMWLNDQAGDCTSAEECAAKAFYSLAQGEPEVKISDAALLAFCQRYGFLNGAALTDVMDAMASSGMIDGGVTYKDGPYTGVDFSDEATLQNAIAQGPVKLGIDADALPSRAGNGSGWYAFGGTPGQFPNEDHCINSNGFGPAAAVFAAFNAPLPSGCSPTKTVYIIYTWAGQGIVDHDWIMSCCGEAWVRVPTTVDADSSLSGYLGGVQAVNWPGVVQVVELVAQSVLTVLQYLFPAPTSRRK